MYNLSDTVERKYIETIDVDEWEIETDTGWQDIKSISKTVEYDVWYIETESGKFLEGADNHIIFDESGNEIFVKDCDSGITKILTRDGPELVTKVFKHERPPENMYDLNVNSNEHRFYSNDILSHNSTTMVAYFLYFILFNKHKKVAILANKRDTAIELLSRLQLAFELLPSWLQQGVKVWNKSRIELENGCIIEAHATSSASVRGKTFNIIFLDEFAHIENKLADKFWTSTFPVISSGKTSKVIIVSTPNGENLFKELWDHSNLDHSHPKWNQFTPIEVHYTQVPGREKPEWAENMISIIGQSRFDQEFGNFFLGSSGTLISRQALQSMTVGIPIHSQNNLDVYKDPTSNINTETGIKSPHVYVICVDTARGVQLDYSALTVIDVTDAPYEVVAKYRSNVIPPSMFSDQIVPIARRYNNAYVLFELDGPGYQVAEDLHHIHEYENILLVSSAGRGGQILSTGFGTKSKNVQRGVKMSTPVRRNGCANLKTLIETKRLINHDNDIRAEFLSFCLKGDKYQAEEGKHDDLVMTLVSFAWLTGNKHFRDLMEAKIRQSLEMEFAPQFEHDLTPFGFIDDGISREEKVFMPNEIWVSTQSEVWESYAHNERIKATIQLDRYNRLSNYFGWS